MRLTLCIQVDHEVLEDVHVSCVCNGASGRGTALAVDEGYRLCTHVQHQSIHQGHIVLAARFIGYLMGVKCQLASHRYVINRFLRISLIANSNSSYTYTYSTRYLASHEYCRTLPMNICRTRYLASYKYM